ncbi:hypothetical protein [Christiangramia sp.]|uniref:hypothetical protein n=1 Tax=Christiangramia sp. TaxID=1931228 RepID=UPI002635D642|nr:hypothetical protein [Christiangramia sp.]
MEFNLAEKLAIVKDIDRLILADHKVAKGELIYLGQLMKLLKFNSDFVEEARKFNIQQANGILENMSEAKKHSLAIMLHEMAYADGDMSREEIKILFSVFKNVGIKIEDSGKPPVVFDISDIYFKSKKYIIHDKELDTSMCKLGEPKAIKIEPQIDGKNGFTVTIFKVTGFTPFWGNKVELALRHMDIVELSLEKSFLRACNHSLGKDSRPSKKSDYGLSIYHPNNQIERIILHKYHKNKELEFVS